jgi:hypothetical protein
MNQINRNEVENGIFDRFRDNMHDKLLDSVDYMQPALVIPWDKFYSTFRHSSRVAYFGLYRQFEGTKSL